MDIKNYEKLKLADYGFIATMMPEDVSGTPARITAVHKERYELICEYGQTYGRLKTSIYFGEFNESFPTAGDLLEKQQWHKDIAKLSKQIKKNGGFKK